MSSTEVTVSRPALPENGFNWELVKPDQLERLPEYVLDLLNLSQQNLLEPTTHEQLVEVHTHFFQSIPTPQIENSNTQEEIQLEVQEEKK